MCEKASFYKVYLNCRRGMLELDIIFIKFLEQEYMFLSDDLKCQFDNLLQESDQDLYMCLVKDNEFDNLYIADIIKTLKNFIKKLKFS